MAQVSVHEEYSFARDGERQHEVGGYKGLARALIVGGNDIYVLLAMPGGHKLHVGADIAKCLVHQVLLVWFHYQALVDAFVSIPQREEMMLHVLAI